MSKFPSCPDPSDWSSWSSPSSHYSSLSCLYIIKSLWVFTMPAYLLLRSALNPQSSYITPMLYLYCYNCRERRIEVPSMLFQSSQLRVCGVLLRASAWTGVLWVLWGFNPLIALWSIKSIQTKYIGFNCSERRIEVASILFQSSQLSFAGFWTMPAY